jgi:pullulanase/glycogen debranching enzyme
MIEGQGVPDIAWLRPDGSLMQPEDWESGFGRAVGVFLNGRGIRERDYRGEPIVDKHFIVLFNAGDDIIDFHMPLIDVSPRTAERMIVRRQNVVSLLSVTQRQVIDTPCHYWCCGGDIESPDLAEANG